MNRDREIVNKICEFNGLTLDAISELFFQGSTHASRRMNKLAREGLVKKKFVYNKRGKTAKRKCVIYTATAKAINLFNLSYHPNTINPKKNKLDIQFMISKLKETFPSIKSKRDIRGQNNLNNSLPVDCALKEKETTFFYIVSQSHTDKDIQGKINFIHDFNWLADNHIIIARNYNKKYNTPLSYEDYICEYFIFRYDHLVPIRIARFLEDKYYYLKVFNQILSRQLTEFRVDQFSLPFSTAFYKGKQIYFTELISGSSRILQELNFEELPQKLFILVEDKSKKRWLPKSKNIKAFSYLDKKFIS